jgi:hypothetical protein
MAAVPRVWMFGWGGRSAWVRRRDFKKVEIRSAIWRIISDYNPTSPGYLDRMDKDGWFETEITIKSPVRYLAVQALDSHHDVLGTSPVRPR